MIDPSFSKRQDLHSRSPDGTRPVYEDRSRAQQLSIIAERRRRALEATQRQAQEPEPPVRRTVSFSDMASVSPAARRILAIEPEQVAEPVKIASPAVQSVPATYEPPVINPAPVVIEQPVTGPVEQAFVAQSESEINPPAVTEAIKATPKRGLFKNLVWYTGGAFAAMLVLAITGYVSIDTWVTNNEVKTAMAERSETTLNPAALLGEGEDEEQVEDSAIDKYTVAPDLPRVLSIEKIGVKSRVLPMSVNKDGTIQAPINISDSGWYNGSAKPGEAGAAFIDAHASGATRQGLFAYLDQLERGDIISLERGDGSILRYKVAFTEEKRIEDIDMKKVLQPYGKAKEGLNLMTCKGTWVAKDRTYDSRVIVYTERI